MAPPAPSRRGSRVAKRRATAQKGRGGGGEGVCSVCGCAASDTPSRISAVAVATWRGASGIAAPPGEEDAPQAQNRLLSAVPVTAGTAAALLLGETAVWALWSPGEVG